MRGRLIVNRLRWLIYGYKQKRSIFGQSATPVATPKENRPIKILYLIVLIGAGTKSRTRDLLITNQLLYQLSYAGFLFGFTVLRLAGLLAKLRAKCTELVELNLHKFDDSRHCRLRRPHVPESVRRRTSRFFPQ